MKITHSFHPTPGAGKGTIGAYIKSAFNYDNYSSGDLLRGEVNNNTDIGLKIKETLNDGKQVEDSLITTIVINKIDNLVKEKANFVFDGFPQTDSQQKALDDFSFTHKELELHYIFVMVDEKKALDRMVNRLSCKKCNAIYCKTLLKNEMQLICENCSSQLMKRESDNCEKAINRLKIFKETTRHLIDEIKSRKICFVIDGDNPLLSIQEKVNDFILSFCVR